MHDDEVGMKVSGVHDALCQRGSPQPHASNLLRKDTVLIKYRY